jgi:hypothetical protein
MNSPSADFEIPNLERWMPHDVIVRARAIEDQLFDVWSNYLQTIGPSVVRAYREGKLQEEPYEHVFRRVSERMLQMVRESTIAEELAQDAEAE